MMNERLQRVQINRDEDVPFEKNGDIWVLLIYENGDWDADSISGSELLKNSQDEKVKNIFCVWHGQHRTNLFSINKTNFVERLKKMKGLK